MASFFTTKSIGAWVSIVGDVLERRTASFPASVPFDIAPVVRSANFEVASRIFLACDSPDVMKQLNDLILKSHSYSTRKLRSFVNLPGWVPARSHRVVNKVEKQIDGIFHTLVSGDRKHSPPSVLDHMLAERTLAGGRSLQDIRYSTVGLLLACEPVAITTTLALHLLGKDQALQERIFDEIMQAKSGSSVSSMSHSDLRELGLLNRFIDEVHRLYPAEWLLTREAVWAERLPSGLLVRRGDQVMISLYCLHRSANRFPDPDRVDPDRFRHGPKSSAYIPFGAGPRACLGQPLARLMISMALAAMLSKWRVESLKDDIGLDSLNCFSIAAKGPVSMRLHERNAIRCSSIPDASSRVTH
jgi:cytochrome P450